MLIVHYENLKHFDADKNCWEGQFVQKHRDDKKQADTLGWLMMTIGVHEITEKNIDEIMFRTKYLDAVHGSNGFIGNPSNTDLRQLFKNHIGLKIVITNRGMANITTRHKFMVRHLKSLEERIEKEIK
jgi:N-acetylglutamate synthase/N-acetylornithine aminotransferase